jgi:hypothetical protein
MRIRDKHSGSATLPAIIIQRWDSHVKLKLGSRLQRIFVLKYFIRFIFIIVNSFPFYNLTYQFKNQQK